MIKRRYPTGDDLSTSPVEEALTEEATEFLQELLKIAQSCNRKHSSFSYAGGCYGVKYDHRKHLWKAELEVGGSIAGMFANYESATAGANQLNNAEVELPRLVGRRVTCTK